MKNNIKLSIISIITVLLITLIPFSVFAAEGSEPRIPRFYDEEGLLTSEQASVLTAKLDEISERQRFDVVVVVVYELDHREARLFAADFLEESGYGFGEELDSAILLLAVKDRDFGFASFGYGLEVFTTAGQDYLDKLFLPYLREDDYYNAFMAFADGVDDFLTQAKESVPYDSGNIPMLDSERARHRRNTIIWSLVIGLVIALIVNSRLKRQLKSVKADNLAQAYIRPGSLSLRASYDTFLHSSVSRVERSSDSDSGGGGGGSSFSSSSGRSATGHSGKY